MLDVFFTYLYELSISSSNEINCQKTLIKFILHAYLDFPWVVSVVEEQKSFKEYPRKNAATAIDPNTTATHPTLRSQVWEVVASPKYFQPCKLVRLQNSSKVIIFAKLFMSVVFIIDRFRSKVGSLFCYDKRNDILIKKSICVLLMN